MTEILWTAQESDLITGGKATQDWRATGVSIDTRTLRPGELFVALEGRKMDGHDYVAQALEKGAAAALVSRAPDGAGPLLVVDDTLQALQALGRAARDRSGALIVGVTGSVGKTGTKEMLVQAFGALGLAYASKASHNNHWGVPLSLCNMPHGADYGIFEIGMNHAGEIEPLSKMVRPHIAIITTVTEAHIENLGSAEAIARAKAEIFDGMAVDGVAILNRDNPHFDLLVAEARSRGLTRILSFGENIAADACLIDCIEAANGTRIKAAIGGGTVEFTLRFLGRHIALNALSVLLAIHVAGGDVQRAATALGEIEPLAGRGKRELVNVGDPSNPVVLIDESYNASPSAMKAAFRVLALIDPGRGGRRIAVLGDMYELGADAAKIHKELSLPLEAAGVQLLYTSGPLMKNLYDAVPEKTRGAHNDDTGELSKIVLDVIVPGDVVMVKGSRGGGQKPRMQVIVEALRAHPANKSQKQGA